MALPQEQPMLTVKEAAEILGVDPRTIREKLLTKQVRGEKRLHGLKEKWYVNKADIDALAQDQYERSAELHEQRVTTDDIEPLFDAEDTTTSDAVEVDEVRDSKQPDNSQLEMLIGAMTKQFSEELSQHKEIVFELKKDLEEKERQLKLLPDLEKQARERQQAAELKEFENQALKKQLELIEEEKRLKEEEYSLSKEELELLSKKEEELKEKLNSVSKEKENSIKAREEELEKLKAELEEKDKALEQFQKPWWKKWFLPQEPEQ